MKNIHVLPTTPNDETAKGIWIKETRDWCNIYITSPNEDINDNDYIITKDCRLVQVSYLLSKDLEAASKVVLTTDQDLIKDGVQAINDEFLEWFVKNPSCEWVETEIVEYGFDEVPIYNYKIIIPKEEPKQKTLEEIAINYVKYNVQIHNAIKEAVKFGANLQAERMYNSIKELYDNENITGFSKRAYAQCLDIIEQFKNK